MKCQNHGHGQKSNNHHEGVLADLACHFPYAVLSVSICLAILSFFSLFVSFFKNDAMTRYGASMLFHSFHFMHIAFAATGTLITFLRFNKSYVLGLLISIVSPAIFCTLSDAIIPYIGGRMLGVAMTFHLCFLTELWNIIPFLLAGIVNGFILGHYDDDRIMSYSLLSHSIHIFVSSLASTFYLVAHGFLNWYEQIGMVFVFLIIAVVLPCTLSDIIVPSLLAKIGKR